MMAIDINAVRATARDVRAAFRQMPDEPYRGAKSIFPHVWCEWASIALAEVLAARGLGEWTLVENKLPDSLSGHAWIELRGDDGTVLFTIDITLDQFPEFDDWYMGAGPTPALGKFRRSNYVGPWRTWPEATRNRTYEAYAKKLVDFLG
jgi:hypothetical protein